MRYYVTSSGTAPGPNDAKVIDDGVRAEHARWGRGRDQLRAQPTASGRGEARVRHRGRSAQHHGDAARVRPCGSPTGGGSRPTSTARASCSCVTRARSADFHLIGEDPAVDERYNEETAATARGAHRRGAGVHARERQAALRRIRGRQSRAVVEREAGALPARRQHRRLGRRVGAHGGHVRPRGRPRRARAVRDVQRVADLHPATAGLPVGRVRRAVVHHRRRGGRHRDHRGTGRGRHRPRHGRLPPQPRAPLVLLPRHDGRRGDRVQIRRQRSGHARCASPHTAFTDPTCPPGVPTRASVEMRALALFD